MVDAFGVRPLNPWTEAVPARESRLCREVVRRRDGLGNLAIQPEEGLGFSLLPLPQGVVTLPSKNSSHEEPKLGLGRIIFFFSSICTECTETEFAGKGWCLGFCTEV
jgi:hypothetical protein